MAHIGQQYRVHFRRDFTQNITGGNRFGYPDRYVLYDVNAGIGNPFWPGMPNFWRSNSAIDGTGPILTYLWPSETCFGKTITAEYAILSTRTPTRMVYARLDLYVDGISELRIENSDPEPLSNASGLVSFFDAHVYDHLAAAGIPTPFEPAIHANFWRYP
jgi:hypothetical protein